MDTDNLVHMANRIGEFFLAMPDQREGAREVAQHLCRFWEPRMRRQLLAHADAEGDGLLPLVVQALREHRDTVAPPVTR